MPLPPNHRHLANRVHADGRLVSTPARGTLMGNRGGKFHDCVTRSITKRVAWAGKQWISCVLDFKERQRTVWGQGYTELFFLDEVTALSAGHRPCFECRRPHAVAFQNALFAALGTKMAWKKPPKVALMDRLLHPARTDPTPNISKVDELPTGTLFTVDGTVFAKIPNGLMIWTMEGYRPARTDGLTSHAQILTPAPIVAALAHGYLPQWHPSSGNLHVD